jgi:16S rRNA G527 N7-methylase RsmG
MNILTLESKSSTEQKRALDKYVGIVLEVNDPFNLCIKLDDIKISSKNVKVLIYFK